MPQITLDLSDATELAETLTLLTQWLTELADQDDGVTPAAHVPLLNS